MAGKQAGSSRSSSGLCAKPIAACEWRVGRGGGNGRKFSQHCAKTISAHSCRDAACVHVYAIYRGLSAASMATEMSWAKLSTLRPDIVASLPAQVPVSAVVCVSVCVFIFYMCLATVNWPSSSGISMFSGNTNARFPRPVLRRVSNDWQSANGRLPGTVAHRRDYVADEQVSRTCNRTSALLKTHSVVIAHSTALFAEEAKFPF